MCKRRIGWMVLLLPSVILAGCDLLSSLGSGSEPTLSISPSSENVSVAVGAAYQLTVTARDKDGNVDWFSVSSANSTIASVSRSGDIVTITGVSEGTTSVTVESFSDITKTISVTVTPGTSTTAGSMTVGGQTHELSRLYLEDYGEWYGVYNIDVNLLGGTLDFDEETGSGDFLYLEMFFDANAPSMAGSYVYSEYEDAGTFSDYSYIIIGLDWDTGNVDEVYLVTGGTVEINVTGSEYSISGSLNVYGMVSETATTATFEYTGPVTEYYD